MKITIEDVETHQKVIKETDSVCIDDVSEDLVDALLGMGFAKESIINAFEDIVDGYRIYQEHMKEREHGC